MGQFERDYKAGSNVYTVYLRKAGENPCCSLQHFKIMKYDQSPSKTTSFSLKGKSFKHYLILLLTVLVPAFILATLVKCIRTKGLRHKWLWIIFILFGVYGISFNWYTGNLGWSFISKTSNSGYHIEIINLILFGVGITKAGPLAPWIFEIGFPLGAVLFWINARKMKREVIETFGDN